MTANWQRCYAQRTTRMSSSIIREILKITQQPDVISFAGGLPAPESFPVEQIAQAPQQVLATIGTKALQYSPTEGYLPLRQFIIEKMSWYGIHANTDNVLITTGSQQALDLIGRVLIDPGDTILCEAPTYLGALQAWTAYGARYVTVPADDDGMQVEFIEPILKRRKIKFIYALPNFQNPGGTTISLERRIKLVQLADKYRVPIIEDDPYGELRFEGDHLPPLAVLDQERQKKRRKNCNEFECGNVIYTSTFSKTLAPGLRLGWVVAPRQVTFKLVQAKQGADLHSSTFDQYIAYQVVKPEGFFVDHVRKIRQMYKEHRDAMVAAMEKYFPSGVKWTRPQGGLFLWVTLPEGVDTTALLPIAVTYKVAYVPGAPFFPETNAPRRKTRGKQLPVGHNTMRLNFSNASLEEIDLGIQRLGQVIANAMQTLK
jgi:2-aminoadipate transaminase